MTTTNTTTVPAGLCSARCKHKLVWVKLSNGKATQKRWCQTDEARTAPRTLGEALGAFPVETDIDLRLLAIIVKVAL